MIKSLFISLLLACLAGVALSHGSHGHSHDHDHDHDGDKAVYTLTSDTFNADIQEHPLTLVEFFAPWCGHCKALAPNYEAAAKRLAADNSPAVLAAVDCTVEKDLCSLYGVKGFPTLKLFRASANSPADYTGGRTADDIYNFISKQTQPAYTQLTGNDEEFWAKPGVKVVGVFSSSDSDDAKEFLDTASQLRNDYSFALTDSADHVSSHADGTSVSVPSVLLFKDGESAVAHSSSFTAPSLTAFINTEGFPLVGEIGPENFQKYVDRGLPLAWVFYDPSAADSSEQMQTISDAAKVVKGKLSVVKLDGVKWAEHAKHFGLGPELPSIVVEDRAANKNFIYTAPSGGLTTDSLSAHFQGFLDKTLPANVKSQEVPADNDGAVRVVVGKSFDSEVLENEKDVFVEFYAPWCGHCKSLAPKWEELGGMFADNDNVVIAKVDATENDTPAKVQGFPTLIFYPAGKKDQPMPYEGDRTPAAMADFIRAHGGTFSGHDEL